MGALDDALNDLVARRRLTVDLELWIERRVRLYANRLNRRLALEGDTDPYDIDDDKHLAQVIKLLCETALDHDEHDSGLVCDEFTGRLFSREVADEHVHRLRRKRTDEGPEAPDPPTRRSSSWPARSTPCRTSCWPTARVRKRAATTSSSP